jgi:uncharacterized protein DUF4430
MPNQLPNAAARSPAAILKSRWRLPLMLALLLVVIILGRSATNHQIVTFGPGSANDKSAEPEPVTAGKSVTLIIQSPDGNQRHDYLAWHDGMTVADLMVAASQLPKGIHFSQQGSGESCLLTEINGDANQGGDGKNWTYSVNGAEADRSFAIFNLQPGDHVLWTFTTKQ